MKTYVKIEPYATLFKDTFNQGKYINLAKNKGYILNKLLKNEATKEAYLNFTSFLRSKRLKLEILCIGYDTQADIYKLVYQICSTKYNNNPIKIDRQLQINLPFVFIPDCIDEILESALKDVPYDLLNDVANGG